MPVTDVTPLLRNEYDEDTLSNVPIAHAHLKDLKSEPEPPSAKKWQIAATFYSFLVVGATDGAYGLRQYYHANYLTISIVLLSPVIGYLFAAFANNAIHIRYGQRGIAMLGPGLHTIAFLAVALHPPYPVLILAFVLAGLGSGLVDAGWNAWIGSMPDSNGIMGSLHGFYGLGAALSPVVATSVINRLGWQWYGFYYLMGLASALELCSSAAAFWSKTGERYRLNHKTYAESEICRPGEENAEDRLPDERKRSPIVQALGNPSSWLISMFIFLYAGIEISLADWILTLLVDDRNQTPYIGSMLTFSYWGGLTLGRIVIGFLIPFLKSGKGIVATCLVITIICHLVFTFKTDLVASAIVIPLLGFFLGPLFPEAVIMQTKLVHKNLHVAAVGFACALGSAGGCVFPFLVGVLANEYGIRMLQPAVLVMLLLCLACWWLLPRPSEDTAEIRTVQ
ncbi:Bypass of stop codon protein [Lachnellula willkommii]|uniref:Bypass of stop codon protein n=1 Tax=Lachnellula willkommii TaxID=215461 RepID=A0A559MI78_9HELO|nr:Bypass of stop codon protein [Lachnellula willkommii]